MALGQVPKSRGLTEASLAKVKRALPPSTWGGRNVLWYSMDK